MIYLIKWVILGVKDVKKSDSKNKKHQRAKKNTLRFLLFGVVSFAIIVYFFNLVVNMSLEIVGKYKEKDSLNVQLEDLKEEEQRLSTDVLKLQDPEYIARYLREKYYYSKDNEYIIKLPNEK
jgi:cell division protein DivIC